MNPRFFFRRSCLAWAALTFLNFSSLAQVNPLPEVNIWATTPETLEPSANARVIPGEFTITRVGDTNEPLILFVEFTGTAAFGYDYGQVPQLFVMPAGERKWSVPVVPLDDSEVEGDETVIATLSPSPPVNSFPNYTVHPRLNVATVVIHDNDFPNDLPIVSISGASTVLEFCPPNADCVGISFSLRRTSPGLDQPLTAFVRYRGTAIADVDYPGLPQRVTFEAGSEIAMVHSVPTDDALYEGDETIIAEVIPLVEYRVDPNRWQATTIIRDNETPAPPKVSLEVVDPLAIETFAFQNIAKWAEFRVVRSGPATNELVVFLEIQGSAKLGEDYWLERVNDDLSVRLLPGEKSVAVRLFPNDDDLYEGDETALVRLIAPSSAGDPYSIDAAHSSVSMAIRDNELPASPAVSLVPVEGYAMETRIDQNAIIWGEFRVLRTGPVTNELVVSLDTRQGSAKLGEDYSLERVKDSSTVRFLPGERSVTVRLFPIDDDLYEGDETALIRLSVPPPTGDSYAIDVVHSSVSIVIRDNDLPAPTVVSIEATSRIAEESSFPFRRLALRGELTISRSGPTNDPLSVFVQYTGTATPGVDSPRLPALVTIPAGTTSTRIDVVPTDDGVSEGIETLTAALSHCPADTDPPLGIPCCSGFEIDPSRARATVFLRDDGITRASLAITKPTEGANFNGGATILIEATAIDLEGYLSRVEFFDGDQRIGESEIVFIRAPEPGTPIHHSFEWRGAVAGSHVLTARVTDANGEVLMSPPVRIIFGPESNQPPRVALSRPVSGAQFPPDTAIEIVAATRDPDGYVPQMEFFADGRKIGESRVEFIRPPEPGQSQTFAFVWRHPAPGSHAFTARATDDDGGSTTSAPVSILVVGSEPLPIVSVTTRDAWAVEPGENSNVNTAAFRIRRSGPTDDPLVVAYSLRGTAENGTDYELLAGLATIPTGSRAVLVTVNPLADRLREGRETVVLRLEEPPPPSPEVRVISPYRVGWPRLAGALINDPLSPHGGPRCIALPGHLVHLCFAAESGRNFRVEASGDLRNWETLGDNWSSDGEWHFIDTETESQAHRFYRLTPEPVAEADE